MKTLTRNECKEVNGGYDLLEEAKHFDLWKFVKEVFLGWED